MQRSINISFIILRLILGIVMILGGINKFKKPLPLPTDGVKIENLDGHEPDANKLRRTNYTFGMRQSGYAWQVLGVTEIVGGLLLVTQVFSFIGALVLLPVVFQIFLFHVFLEPHEKWEMVLTALYLVINLLLIFKEWRYLKPLLRIKVL